MPKKTLTFALMDCALRVGKPDHRICIDAAARRGHDINVFAYREAPALAFAPRRRTPTRCTARTSPKKTIPRRKIRSQRCWQRAARNGGKVDWVNCGMCVDERGVNQFVPGTRRGSPADFHAFTEASDNTLVIPTK